MNKTILQKATSQIEISNSFETTDEYLVMWSLCE